ncbi:MAG: hypothetical protein V4702_02660 [Patescibacteria group bacterium]
MELDGVTVSTEALAVNPAVESGMVWTQFKDRVMGATVLTGALLLGALGTAGPASADHCYDGQGHIVGRDGEPDCPLPKHLIDRPPETAPTPPPTEAPAPRPTAPPTTAARRQVVATTVAPTTTTTTVAITTTLAPTTTLPPTTEVLTTTSTTTAAVSGSESDGGINNGGQPEKTESDTSRALLLLAGIGVAGSGIFYAGRRIHNNGNKPGKPGPPT